MTGRGLLVASALLCLPASAAAQPARQDPTAPVVDEQTRARARALVDQGVEAFDAGEYQTALGRFRAAYELVPLEQLRFNIALCYERLARPRQAVEQYEALIDAESLSIEARRRAREGVERLRSRLATLRFSGAIGATVRVDGDASCTVPCELSINPGRHTVEGVGAGRRSVELAEGESLRLLALAPVVAPAPSEPGYSPGPLFYVGGGAAILGLGGAIGFGLVAQERHSEFVVVPSEDVAMDGSLMRDLSNISVAVVALGGALVLLDILLGITG